MITLEVKEQDEIGLTVNGSMMPMPDEYCIGGSIMDKTAKEYYCKRDITDTRPNLFAGFSELTHVELPDTVETLWATLFADCTKLKISKLPASLKKIQGYVFRNCESIEEIEIPAQVESIVNGAFFGCSGLKKVVFKGTPPKRGVMVQTFFNCGNLLDIYVPWNEGDVDNAPWSAYNATIHYGYTGE